MNFAAVTIAAASLLATSAMAAERMTDVQYLHANRCRGLAEGIDAKSADTASLKAFLKAGQALRGPYILEKAADSAAQAKRQARDPNRRAAAVAELSTSCAAYLSAGSSLAAGAANPTP